MDGSRKCLNKSVELPAFFGLLHPSLYDMLWYYPSYRIGEMFWLKNLSATVPITCITDSLSEVCVGNKSGALYIQKIDEAEFERARSNSFSKMGVPARLENDKGYSYRNSSHEDACHSFDERGYIKKGLIGIGFVCYFFGYTCS